MTEFDQPKHIHYTHSSNHVTLFSRSHIASPSSYSPLSNMKLHGHGGLNKPPSVNQLVGQQPQQHHTAPTTMAHMGECLYNMCGLHISNPIYSLLGTYFCKFVIKFSYQKILMPRKPIYSIIKYCYFAAHYFTWSHLPFSQAPTCTTATTCRLMVIWMVATAVRQ